MREWGRLLTAVSSPETEGVGEVGDIRCLPYSVSLWV